MSFYLGLNKFKMVIAGIIGMFVPFGLKVLITDPTTAFYVLVAQLQTISDFLPS
jgi:hypothetical protein